MPDSRNIIYRNILENMKDGVMTIDFNSQIKTFNPAAESILGIKREDILDKKYAEVFLEFDDNDLFNQTIFDAIYESSINHYQIVNFNTGNGIKTLSLTTSLMHADGKDIGVIAVFSDVTELNELRDAITAMDRIKQLNKELEKRNHFIRETFGRYLSDEIVTTIIERPGGLKLGGKKQDLTIMMTDLRGFTSLSENLAPETVVSMLNNYLAEMTEIILKYGGTIDEFIGDAILAIFGAPVWSADHAERAVACAIDMLLAMEQVNEWNRKQGFPRIGMGIGINTGEVVVGNIGSLKRAKYGIVGSQVNLTSRIESYTIGGQILISDRTKEQIGKVLDIKDSFEVSPKGVNHPIMIHDVLGISGKFNLYLKKDFSDMAKLKIQQPIVYRVVDGKKLTETGLCKANIVELSRHEAIIRSEFAVMDFCNLKVDIVDDQDNMIFKNLYCKVISSKNYPFIKIHFTSVSSQAEDFLSGLPVE